MRRRVVRLVFISVLAPLAWLAWHPERLVSPPPIPAFDVETERELAPGATLRKGHVRGTSWRVIDFALELTKVRLRIGTRDGGGRLAELLPEGAFAAVNGAFFERDLSPHGWLVDDGWELHPLAPQSPTPVLAVSGSRVFIGPHAQLPFTPELALQNFPLLVADGEVKVALHDGDPGYPRTFACLSGDARLHLVVLLPEFLGPSLHETARLAAFPAALGGLGCRAALNLDGGPSSGYWAGPDDQVEPGTPVGHAIALLRR